MTTIVPPSSSSPSPGGVGAKKPSTPGQPWSHLETTSLIDAYEAKWYSLNRGQLKAQQWEEVAAAVAARCPSPAPPKSGTQCRHKIEKLRKRFRAERARPVPSLWPYFERMERMERGPLPVSVVLPISSSPATAAVDSDDSSDDDDDDDDDEDEEYDVKRGSRVDVLTEVAREVRRLGEGMVRMEKRRMEVMREVERDWMEMETKRAEMVVEAQRDILENIAAAFSSATARKKAKRS